MQCGFQNSIRLLKLLKKRKESFFSSKKKFQNLSLLLNWLFLEQKDYIKTESLMRGGFDSSEAHFVKYLYLKT